MTNVAAVAMGACLAIGGASDHVTAGDLAAAAPEWRAIDAATVLALAPAPGVQRVFRAPELRRMAERWKVPVPGDREVCVTRPVAAADPARWLAAMQSVLPEARIEILEYGRQPVPEGELEFPSGGLRHVTADEGFWQGAVKYGARQRFPVWARVKVTARMARVVATEDLAPGRFVEAGLVRVEWRDGFPEGGYARSVEEVAGKAARRAVRAGTMLRPEWLEAPKVVMRGDAVQVEIVRGGARLRLGGIAASAGAIGEMVTVVNPDSKRQFRARVEAQGKVLAGERNP